MEMWNELTLRLVGFQYYGKPAVSNYSGRALKPIINSLPFKAGLVFA